MMMTRLRSNLADKPSGVPPPSSGGQLRKCYVRRAACSDPLKKSASKNSKLALVSTSHGVADIEDLGIEAGLSFTEEEAARIKIKLLDWYDGHHRKLPWRQNYRPDNSSIESGSSSVTHEEADDNNDQLALGLDSEEYLEFQQQRAYATWVSEVMLQQTRVATVVQYFNRWMKKWPTVYHLAGASEEEVNALWAGLGYYRRARFLLEGAKQIVRLQGGLLPSSVDELRKIPGIGKYTAGAIASIAFKQPVPIVDGNVVRVLCRIKAISANPKTSATLKILWALAGQLVDAKRPGDLNQALMELGATICTPAAPACSSCPIGENCKALARSCVLTGFVNPSLVTDFPVKVVKAAPRQEYVAVCVLERSWDTATKSSGTHSSLVDGSFLLVKRPQSGLLAGLWEFPSVSLDGPETSSKIQKAAIDCYLKSILDLKIGQGSIVVRARETVGNYVHVFSHIRLHMSIEWLLISGHEGTPVKQETQVEDGVMTKWVHASAIQDIGLTSGVKKVYEMFLEFRGTKLDHTPKESKGKRKRS